MNVTQQPQFDLLRLQTEYETGEKTCRREIDKILQFSEEFLRSFVDVPPLDVFRDHHLPAAATSSSHILEEVGRQMKGNGEPHAISYYCLFIY